MAVHFDFPAAEHGPPTASRGYAWLVFALTFALMLSDYLSRQVINAVFPFLKADWGLSDTQLGALVSVVALTVGVMSFPVSLLADRWGRVRSASLMALVWGLATVACGLSGNFATLFVARAVVGLGEAGYGSAGGAILLQVFPPRLHATVIGGFLAAAMFGSVLGVVLGGVIAQRLGWQMAFILIGAGGLLLALVYPLVVREPQPLRRTATSLPLGAVLRAVVRPRSARLIYLGSGLQMFIQGSVVAWTPSYLNRYHGMDPAQSAMYAGLVVLVAGVGMTAGGALADRLARHDRRRLLRVPAAYALGSGALLLLAFCLASGTTQLLLLGLGMLVGSGFAGPAGAALADVTSPAIRATVLATLTLANNLIGLAPGPFLTGALADRVGLDTAMCLVPLVTIAASVAYWRAARSYAGDRDAREAGA